MEAAKKILEEAHVLVFPGHGFGESGEGYIRIACTVDEEKIDEVASDVFEYQDKDLEVGIYAYKISASYKNCEESEFTNEVTIAIYTCEPPTKLEGKAEQKTAILTWDKPENIDDELLNYNIYRDEEFIKDVPFNIFEYRDEELENGTYIYQVSAVYKHCTESEWTAGVAVTIDETGICNIQADSFQIFPNPTNGELTVMSSEYRVQSIEIFNVIGQSVYSSTYPLVHSSTLNISHLPTGIYFVRIQAEEGIVTKKVVKM
jgi:hypothetical protein